MRQVLRIALLLACFAANSVLAQQDDTKQVFGFKLGDDVSNLEQQLITAGIRFIKKAWMYTDQDMPGELWRVEGTLKPSSLISHTRIAVYRNRVMEVTFYMKDGSEEAYKQLVDNLDKKYGTYKTDTIGFIDKAQKYQLPEMEIEVTREVKFMEDDVLTIRYVHSVLDHQQTEEFKANKLRPIEAERENFIPPTVFGIILGGSISENVERLKDLGISAIKGAWTYKDQDMPGTLWKFNGVPTSTSLVTTARAAEVEGKIMRVDFSFRDVTKANKEILKTFLTDLYSAKGKEGLTGALFDETKWEYKGVHIELDRDIGFGESDKLELSFTDVNLAKRWEALYQQNKARKVKKELDEF